MKARPVVGKEEESLLRIWDTTTNKEREKKGENDYYINDGTKKKKK